MKNVINLFALKSPLFSSLAISGISQRRLGNPYAIVTHMKKILILVLLFSSSAYCYQEIDVRFLSNTNETNKYKDGEKVSLICFDFNKKTFSSMNIILGVNWNLPKDSYDIEAGTHQKMFVRKILNGTAPRKTKNTKEWRNCLITKKKFPPRTGPLQRVEYRCNVPNMDFGTIKDICKIHLKNEIILIDPEETKKSHTLKMSFSKSNKKFVLKKVESLLYVSDLDGDNKFEVVYKKESRYNVEDYKITTIE